MIHFSELSSTSERTTREITRRASALLFGMDNDDLVLPTPVNFPAFPYDPPYSIQIDLMSHVYTSIEKRQVTIVESPTGTVSVCTS